MAKLLIASLVDPATHPGGAGTYTRGLVAALRRGHTVDLVGPLHAPPGPRHRSRQLMSLAKSCLSELPAKVLFARQHELRLRIRETVRAHDYDAVLINSSDMLWALDALPPLMPTILIAHNLEHQVLIQQLSNSRIFPWMFKREIAKQRRYEIEGFGALEESFSFPRQTWLGAVPKSRGCTPFMYHRCLRSLRYSVGVSPVGIFASGTSLILPGGPIAKTGTG